MNIKTTGFLLWFALAFSAQVNADVVQDPYQDLIKTQNSYPQFQQNYNTILGQIEELTKSGEYAQDPKRFYPVCVAMQSSREALKNNQKYKAEFDLDYKQFNTTYENTLKMTEARLDQIKTDCEMAKKVYFLS